MKTKKIIIGEKEFEIKELLYLDIIELSNINDRRENTLKLMKLSGIDEEIAKNLTIEQGTNLINEINELNGLGKVNFQNPP